MVLITTTPLLNSFHTVTIFTIARALPRYVPSPRQPRRSRGGGGWRGVGVGRGNELYQGLRTHEG